MRRVDIDGQGGGGGGGGGFLRVIISNLGRLFTIRDERFVDGSVYVHIPCMSVILSMSGVLILLHAPRTCERK